MNTPSFLLAALKHLKLVRPVQGKLRHHERLDPQPFLEMVSKLTADVKTGGTSGRSTTRKPSRTSTKKAAVKKRATAKRKKATARTNKSSPAQG